MNRLRFFSKVIVDDKEQLDYLFHSLSNFEMVHDPGFYRIDATDVLRPDLISFKNYGTVNYWWFIMFVNSVFDPLSDLEVGHLLVIPNLLDVYDFFKKYRKR